MVDRKSSKPQRAGFWVLPVPVNPSAKREIANAFLVTDDDVIVCDPEAEYTALVKKFEGQVIKISPFQHAVYQPDGHQCELFEEDNPIALKADFILSLCELIVAGKKACSR